MSDQKNWPRGLGPRSVPEWLSAASIPKEVLFKTEPAHATFPNPKQAFGDKKPPMHLWPETATIVGSLAFADGATKYGPYNWRHSPVEALTYVAAARRHLAAWVDGEANARDSGKPHLGHALACLAIIVDAACTGTLIDNRPAAGGSSDLLETWEKKE